MARFPILRPDQVDEVLLRGGLVLLDFWQASCAPCRALEPRLERFAWTQRGAFTGYRIDVDTDQTTPTRYDVMSIPTLIWLRDGTELARLDGLIRDTDLGQTLAALTRQPPAPDRTGPSG